MVLACLLSRVFLLELDFIHNSHSFETVRGTGRILQATPFKGMGFDDCLLNRNSC